jgi:hypothetical protein
LVERHTRYVTLAKVANKDTQTVVSQNRTFGTSHTRCVAVNIVSRRPAIPSSREHPVVEPDTRFSPIFVHASPRSGSTYFFDALRQNDSLLCFKETIIDGKKDYARFRRTGQRGKDWKSGSHTFLDRPDYEEFIEAWDEVMPGLS